MTTKSRAAAAAEASFDIFTAGISLADIACDIAVAVDFYQRGQLIFFWASLSFRASKRKSSSSASVRT